MNALQGIEDCVEWSEIAVPSYDQGEIRIRVAAAGLDRADLLQKAGLCLPPPGASPALGLECAGVVSGVGVGNTWQVGDRVCVLFAGDGMTEGVVVDVRHVLPVPVGLNPTEATGILEVCATAWLNLLQLAALQFDEKVLLHVGVSGIGSASIQSCKAFGNPCWVSVGSAERLAYCESLGAAGGALRKQSLESLRDFIPFDVILDPIGVRYVGLNLELLWSDGRWAIIDLMSGCEMQLDLVQLLGKRIQLTGSTLRTRDTEFKAQSIVELGLKVRPSLSTGKFHAQLERTFPIGDAEAAFEALASNQMQGKVVSMMDPLLV